MEGQNLKLLISWVKCRQIKDWMQQAAGNYGSKVLVPEMVDALNNAPVLPSHVSVHRPTRPDVALMIDVYKQKLYLIRDTPDKKKRIKLCPFGFEKWKKSFVALN